MIFYHKKAACQGMCVKNYKMFRRGGGGALIFVDELRQGGNKFL